MDRVVPAVSYGVLALAPAGDAPAHAHALPRSDAPPPLALDPDSGSDEGSHHNGSGGSSEDRMQAQRDLDYEEERKALGKIVQNMRMYREFGMADVRRAAYHYSRLSDAHRALAPREPEKHAAMREAVLANADFFDELLHTFRETPNAPSHSRPSHLVGGEEEAKRLADEGYRVNPADEDKVRYVLKNLVRDWSEEGKSERDACYAHVIDALRESCPVHGVGAPAPIPNQDAMSGDASCGDDASMATASNGGTAAAGPANATATSAMPPSSASAAPEENVPRSNPPRVVVAGAGLGRLCCELAALGYEAQGNEYSYYMLLTSSFILNHCQRRHQWRIHPWVHQTCNVINDDDQTRAVTIPDIAPGELACHISQGLLSMCAGDFIEVYREPDQLGQYDAVATCFFIDTAKNVLEYIEVIHGMLRPGGVWINHGPLLYHWADAHLYMRTDELSVELSLETVFEAALKCGFRCLRKTMHTSPYTSNDRSMMRTMYHNASWTMVKAIPTA